MGSYSKLGRTEVREGRVGYAYLTLECGCVYGRWVRKRAGSVRQCDEGRTHTLSTQPRSRMGWPHDTHGARAKGVRLINERGCDEGPAQSFIY